jgi:hypothetical protein
MAAWAELSGRTTWLANFDEGMPLLFCGHPVSSSDGHLGQYTVS